MGPGRDDPLSRPGRPGPGTLRREGDPESHE
jgi:hypothetical protein